jgi:hypothetical protein
VPLGRGRQERIAKLFSVGASPMEKNDGGLVLGLGRRANVWRWKLAPSFAFWGRAFARDVCLGGSVWRHHHAQRLASCRPEMTGKNEYGSDL